MADIHVRFNPAAVSVDVPAGTTLVDAIRAAGLIYGASCGESGICGRCRVGVEPSSALEPPDEMEIQTAARQGLEPDQRLACVARLRADVEVRSALWRER